MLIILSVLRSIKFFPAIALPLLFMPWIASANGASEQITLDSFYQQTQSHPEKTAVYVLEYGEESLLARAWLADHAKKSIDVQYFIWSSDNIGILAAEALLRAADRGVKVRV